MSKTGDITNDMPNGAPRASVGFAGGSEANTTLASDLDAKADAARQEQASAALGAVRTDAWAVRDDTDDHGDNGAVGGDGPADSVFGDGGVHTPDLSTIEGSPQPKRKSAKKSKTKSILDAAPSLPKKRGRPPGGGKTPGSGRKKRIQWTSEKTREYFIEKGNLLETLADLIAGRQMMSQPASGPGRAEWRHPPIELRAKTAIGIYAKCWPDFQVVDQTNRVATPPQADNRQISRAVLQVIGFGVADAMNTNSDRPDSSPAGLRIPGADAPAALRATPDAVSRDDDSPSLSPADSPILDPRGPAERDRMVREGNPHPPKKSTSEKNQIPDDYPSGDTAADAEPVFEPVGSRGHGIKLRQTGRSTGRQKYFIYDQSGNHVAAAWGREQAVKFCEQLIATGQISR